MLCLSTLCFTLLASWLKHCLVQLLIYIYGKLWPQLAIINYICILQKLLNCIQYFMDTQDK
jgi:hypothetical protein